MSICWLCLSHSPGAWLGIDDDSDNDGVEADSWGENDDDKHADEGRTVLRGDESGRGAKDAHADSTE